MTGNGSAIVGIASTSDGYGHAVKWTKETGLVDLFGQRKQEKSV